MRIPTIDSMKRFSAATDFSDIPDFTKPTDEDVLKLPTYLLEQIDIGQSDGSSATPSRSATTREALKLQGRHDRNLEKDRHTVERRRDGYLDEQTFIHDPTVFPERTSTQAPFNPCRPVSQFSVNDGITALPTLASRGMLSNHYDIADKRASMPPPALPATSSRKRKASFSLSAPIKRLRDFSFDTITSKFHKRRDPQLSHTKRDTTGMNISDEKRRYSMPLPSTTPTPTYNRISSSTTRNPTTPSPRRPNALTTTFVPKLSPLLPRLDAPHTRCLVASSTSSSAFK